MGSGDGGTQSGTSGAQVGRPEVVFCKLEWPAARPAATPAPLIPLANGSVIYGNYVDSAAPSRPSSQTFFRLEVGDGGHASRATHPMGATTALEVSAVHTAEGAECQAFYVQAEADFASVEEAYYALYHSATTSWFHDGVPTREAHAWKPRVANSHDGTRLPAGTHLYLRAMPVHMTGVQLDVFGMVWHITVGTGAAPLTAKVLFSGSGPVGDLSLLGGSELQWRDPPAHVPPLPTFMILQAQWQRRYAAVYSPVDLPIADVLTALADTVPEDHLWTPSEADRTGRAVVARPAPSPYHYPYGYGSDDYQPAGSAHWVLQALIELNSAVHQLEGAQEMERDAPGALAVCDYFHPPGWRTETGDQMLDASGNALPADGDDLLQIGHAEIEDTAWIDLAAAQATVHRHDQRLRPYLAGVAHAAAGIRAAVDDGSFVAEISAFIRRGAPQATWALALIADAINQLTLHDTTDSTHFGLQLAAVLCGQAHADGVAFSETRFVPLRDALVASAASLDALNIGPLAPSGSPAPTGQVATEAPEEHLTEEQERQEQVENYVNIAENVAHTVEIYGKCAEFLVRYRREAVAGVLEGQHVMDFLSRHCGQRVMHFLRAATDDGHLADLSAAWGRRHPGGRTLAEFLEHHHAGETTINRLEHAEHAEESAHTAHEWGEWAEGHVNFALESFAHAVVIFNTISATVAMGSRIFTASLTDEEALEARRDWLEFSGVVGGYIQEHYEHAAEEAAEGTAEHASLERAARCAHLFNFALSAGLAGCDFIASLNSFRQHGFSAESFTSGVAFVGDLFSLLGDAFDAFPATEEIGLVFNVIGFGLAYFASSIGEYMEERREERWGEEVLGAEAYKRRMLLSTRYANDGHRVPWFREVRLLPGDGHGDELHSQHKLRVEARPMFPGEASHLGEFGIYAMVRFAGWYDDPQEPPPRAGDHRNPWVPLRLGPPGTADSTPPYWAVLLPMIPIDGVAGLDHEPGAYVVYDDPARVPIDYEPGWTVAEEVPESKNDPHPDLAHTRTRDDWLAPTRVPAITGPAASGSADRVALANVAIPVVAQVFVTGNCHIEGEAEELVDVRRLLVDETRSIYAFPNAGISEVRAFVPSPQPTEQLIVPRHILDVHDTDGLTHQGVRGGVQHLLPDRPVEHAPARHHAQAGGDVPEVHAPPGAQDRS